MYNFNNYDNDMAYSYDDYIKDDEENDEEQDSYEDRRLEEYER